MPDQTQQQDPGSQHDQPDTEAEDTQPHPGTTGGMDEQPDHGEKSYQGSGRLQDKRAVVTGGDSGIGRAVALAFAREGADVAIAYLDEHADARGAARSVEEAGRRALTISGDIGSEAHCRSLVDRTIRELGRIDVLVNNAAFQREHEDIAEFTSEELERTFRTNVFAMFWLCQAALPHLPRGGSIINVSSIQAYEPSPTLLAYATTKGAIVTFSKALSKQAIERGVRVNVVAPGPVWTPLIPSTMPDETLESFGADTPIGRAAQPAELAPAFVFLASDESRYITGEVIGVTGGKLLP
jgi:NAD(P)-dependent dehydrogenase (short-subunit alcohol dehydrogenase family)